MSFSAETPKEIFDVFCLLYPEFKESIHVTYEKDLWLPTHRAIIVTLPMGSEIVFTMVRHDDEYCVPGISWIPIMPRVFPPSKVYADYKDGALTNLKPFYDHRALKSEKN